MTEPAGHSSLTVDVEEYYHASNLDEILGPAKWHSLESRVERSTIQLLDIFDEFSAKGTFFSLGSMSRRHPQLIKEISDRGHEIASHGYGHRIVYTQTARSFYRDIRKAKLLLEDLTGKQVIGYRAPNFSITDGCLWAYDELVKAGYSYDSSLYPVKHPRYGNAHRKLTIDRVSTLSGEITVIPLSVKEFNLAGQEFRLGVAGGGWWRLLPKTLIFSGLRVVENFRNLNCYLHPWEIDPGQPHYSQLSALSRFRHYTGIAGFSGVVRSYLKEFGSTPLQTLL